jgi:acyl-CoA reductase-like NAD-dependent aldehyde dehydrogenase
MIATGGPACGGGPPRRGEPLIPTARAATVSIDLADRVSALQAAWRERAGQPRAGSAGAPAPVGERNVGHVAEAELVEVGAVPAREGVVDRVARAAKVWLRAAAKIRPGRGARRSPRPSTRSTRIDSPVRVICVSSVWSPAELRPLALDRVSPAVSSMPWM